MRLLRLTRRFLTLERSRQLRVCNATAVLVMVWLALRVAPRRVLQIALRYQGEGLRLGRDAGADRRALATVGRVIPGLGSCLIQAVAAKMLSGQEGIVRIGVARGPDGRIQAHAWLEDAAGRILAGEVDDLEAYQPFPLANR